MGYYIVAGLLVFCASVIAEESQPLFVRCRLSDQECILKSGDAFAERAGDGIGAPYNIKPTDPAELAAVDIPACCDTPHTSIIHFKNIKAYGLKHAKMTAFTMDTKTKTAVFNCTVNYRVVADVTFEYIGKDKSYSGTMEITNANVASSSTYNYNIEVDKEDSAVSHLIIGPEKTICEPLNDPQLKLNAELEEAFNNDPEIKQNREDQAELLAERRKKFACSINAFAMPKLIQAWRTTTKIMKSTDLIILSDE